MTSKIPEDLEKRNAWLKLWHEKWAPHWEIIGSVRHNGEVVFGLYFPKGFGGPFATVPKLIRRNRIPKDQI